MSSCIFILITSANRHWGGMDFPMKLFNYFRICFVTLHVIAFDMLKDTSILDHSWQNLSFCGSHAILRYLASVFPGVADHWCVTFSSDTQLFYFLQLMLIFVFQQSDCSNWNVNIMINVVTFYYIFHLIAPVSMPLNRAFFSYIPSAPLELC